MWVMSDLIFSWSLTCNVWSVCDVLGLYVVSAAIEHAHWLPSLPDFQGDCERKFPSPNFPRVEVGASEAVGNGLEEVGLDISGMADSFQPYFVELGGGRPGTQPARSMDGSAVVHPWSRRVSAAYSTSGHVSLCSA